MNWAVIGTGWIANDMATAMAVHGKKFAAVASRTYSKAVEYVGKYGIEKVYQTVEEVCADDDIDIVYIATPHNTHASIAEMALAHGKHVLAEKAIVLNSLELEKLMTLAAEKKLILAEAMTLYHMPVYKQLRKILDSDELGKVQVLSVNFGSFKPYDMTNRFFSPETAGGAMLDLGVYAISAVREFMDGKPTSIKSHWRLTSVGTDEYSSFILKNDQNQMASVTIAMHSKLPKRVTVSCERGYIEVTEYPRADKAVIVNAETGEVTHIEAGEEKEALWYEVLDMEEAILSGNASSMHLDYTKDVMDVMTTLRKEWGMKYPGEEW